MGLGEGEIAVRVRIHGRVQGVWFRGWTADAARALGLRGWVRNRLDGTVEALFAGPEAKVEAIIELCREGPSAARVDHVERAPADQIVAGQGFVQRPTA